MKKREGAIEIQIQIQQSYKKIKSKTKSGENKIDWKQNENLLDASNKWHAIDNFNKTIVK